MLSAGACWQLLVSLMVLCAAADCGGGAGAHQQLSAALSGNSLSPLVVLLG